MILYIIIYTIILLLLHTIIILNRRINYRLESLLGYNSTIIIHSLHSSTRSHKFEINISMRENSAIIAINVKYDWIS